MRYLDELHAAVVRTHRCQASHTRTETVTHAVNGQVLWSGKVEVFALLGHDDALRCYAWGGPDAAGRWDITTVLAIPPVVSAESAVIAAFLAELDRASEP